MDQNKQMIGAVLGIFLCATGCAFAQFHHRGGQNQGWTSVPETPTQKAKSDKQWRFAHAASVALDAGQYDEAEADARQSISIGQDSGLAQELLASALNAQGKTEEALQAYKVIADQGGEFARNLVPYARLLLKTGQWAQAVAAYNKALPDIGDGNMIQANSHFSPDVPQPRELAVALHIAQGLTYGVATWGGHMRKEEAMGEFEQALQLAPNSALTNYYYGFGWQHLDLKSRVRAAHAPQAKAALQKAASSGNGEVKRAAEKALRSFK